MHADTTRLADLRPAVGTVVDILVETVAALPALDAGSPFRDEGG